MICTTTACPFSTSQRPKWPTHAVFFTILTWKCASYHSGVHFFDISSSKSGPRPPGFNMFDFEMCWAPQWRALFPHLNFQEWSGAEVLCTSDFEICFAPQWGALFPHFNSQKCPKPGVQYFISHLLKWLRAAALASLLFEPAAPQNIVKTHCFTTFLPFHAPGPFLY